jgi:hypothetical protein
VDSFCLIKNMKHKNVKGEGAQTTLRHMDALGGEE